jgi:hypothetical protein
MWQQGIHHESLIYILKIISWPLDASSMIVIRMNIVMDDVVANAICLINTKDMTY